MVEGAVDGELVLEVLAVVVWTPVFWGVSCTPRPLVVNGCVIEIDLEGLVVVESDRVPKGLCVLDNRVVEDSIDEDLEREDLAVVARTLALCEDLCTLEELVVNDGVEDTDPAVWVVVESDRGLESPCVLDDGVFEGGIDADLILEEVIIVVRGLVL